jgi:hypothetical protein
MAVQPVHMCFICPEMMYEWSHGAPCPNKYLHEACAHIAEIFANMEIGLIIRGECLVCDKKFIARYKGVFEIAVAVGEKTREVKMLGIICKRCMRRSKVTLRLSRPCFQEFLSVSLA